MTAVDPTSHDLGHGAGAPPHRRSIFMRPGFDPGGVVLRALLPDRALPRRRHPLAGRLGPGLRLDDHRPRRRAWSWRPSDSCSASAPFDYWLYWVSGRPTRPDDHANHGAYSWKDYFKVNTDHKVIGMQYL